MRRSAPYSDVLPKREESHRGTVGKMQGDKEWKNQRKFQRITIESNVLTQNTESMKY